VSEKDLDLARRAYDPFNRRDLDAFLGLCDLEIEVVSMLAGVEGETYRGRDGVARWFEDLSATFREMRVEPQAFVDCGDWVLVTGVTSARGKSSGLEIDWPWAHAFKAREGRISSWGLYRSEAEAREAAMAFG